MLNDNNAHEALAARRPLPIRLSAAHQTWIVVALATLLVTGIVWLIFDRWITVPGAFGPTRHPAQPWLMKLHGAFAMLILVLLGSVLPGHVKKAWQRRKNLFLGIALMGAMALLIGSGYALYYFVSDDNRGLISALHWVTGLVLLPIFVGHMVSGLKSARQPEPRVSVPPAHSARASARQPQRAGK